MAKFTIKQFRKMYPNEKVCLDVIFQARYSKLPACPSCGVEKAKFFRVKNRKCYACEWCGYQVHPLGGTIFHKSSTPLTAWFYAIYLFSVSKNGVSAKELERQLGVTYKCAWRMAKQIRLLFSQSEDILSGVVEVDEMYVGGRSHVIGGRSTTQKIPVMGAVERKGKVKALVLDSLRQENMLRFMKDNIKKGTHMMSDDLSLYHVLPRLGYTHDIINHTKQKYVDGNIYTNTIEGVWSLIKRSLRGTYIHVSGKYLQLYINEFTWRYSHRKDAVPFFSSLLQEVCDQAPSYLTLPYRLSVAKHVR